MLTTIFGRKAKAAQSAEEQAFEAVRKGRVNVRCHLYLGLL